MPSQPGSQGEWRSENVENYRLRRADLVDWLKRKFPKEQYGRDDFNVQVVSSARYEVHWLKRDRRDKTNSCSEFHEN